MSVLPCDILHCGDVYLFHETNPRCPGDSSLWGVISSQENGNITFESSTVDHRHFMMWQPLAVHYRYCRLATRSELRDYMVNLMYAEMCKLE